MQLYAIPPDRLPEFWTLIEPFAQKIENRFPNEWPVYTIHEATEAKELQLWMIADEDTRKVSGVVGTRIITKASGKKVLDIAWMAGENREEWMHLLPKIEAFGADEGCEAIGFTGRWGWAPDLPDYQVEKLAHYEKALTEARQRQAA